MRVCEDPVIVARSRKREAKPRPAYLASVVSGYGHASAVINAMTAKELQQLKERLGIRPEREYAVVR